MYFLVSLFLACRGLGRTAGALAASAGAFAISASGTAEKVDARKDTCSMVSFFSS